MKNKITISNLEDEFFSRLASAIEVDFPTENSALVAISTLSMIWDKYNIPDYMKNFHIDKETYKKYFKKNIDISTIQKHMFNKEFKNKEVHKDNFNFTFEAAYKEIKSSKDLGPRKKDLIIALLQIVRERVLKINPTILQKDITTDEYFAHLDEIFFKNKY